jgi:hypothetical protein
MISGNKIIENLFTKGGEYVLNDLKSTFNNIKDTFVGYYNILFNGKTYTGKTYTNESVELIPVGDLVKSIEDYTALTGPKDVTKYFIEDDSISDQKRFKQIGALEFNNIALRPLDERRNIKLIRATDQDLIDNMDELDKKYPGFASYYMEDPDMDGNIVKKNYSVSFDFNQ